MGIVFSGGTMSIHFVESSETEIVNYVKVHQIYVGRQKGIVLWSFSPIFKGQMFEIIGPVVAFTDKKMTTGKSARYMSSTKKHFQIPGKHRWYPPESMAEFAWHGTHGFAWRDFAENPPKSLMETVGLGYVFDDRVSAIPYYQVCRRDNSEKHAFEFLLTLCEGYGFAQEGMSYEPIKRKETPRE